MATQGTPRLPPPWLFALVLYGAVFSVLFAPMLAGEATVVHGDGVSVSLPLQHVLASALAEGRLPLWSDQIYGGHPVFAEGQGGFAHPLNLLLFGALPAIGWFPQTEPGLVAPATIYAHGLFHVLCGLIAALGTFGLSRCLGLGVVASIFAGLALACSQDWLWQSSNSAIAGASAFVPSVLLALEWWWRRPTVSRAVVLAFAASLLILAGYPQALHGVAIFALVSLAVRIDRDWLSNPWRHVATGLLALSLAAGLSAIQLLPTLELVGESVRADGVGLATSATPAMQFSGLLFSIGQRAAIDPSLGSILCVALAGIGLRASRTVLGLLLATLVLFQLSAADHSPIYRALHHTLPLLDSFRITHLYATLAIVGVAVLAGFGVERLSQWRSGRSANPRPAARKARASIGPEARASIGPEARPGRAVLAAWLAFLLALAAACFTLADEFVPDATFAFPIAAGVAVAVLLRARRSAWIAPVLLVVLLAEIAVLRLPLHDFVDVRVVREPPPIVRELTLRRAEDPLFRIANVPRFFSYLGFASASAPDLERLAGLFLSSLDAGSNLLWSLSSVNANLALPLARRSAVEPLIEAEVRGESPRLPSTRFIDLFGVRYAVVHKQHRDRPFAADLHEVYYDDDYRFHLLENLYAGPRVRFVASSDARSVADAAGAVAALSLGDSAALFVEADPAAFPPDAGDPVRPAASFVTGSASAERYVTVLDVHVPGFLVISDAMYPGWLARVNGAPAALFAANALEKAVPLSLGRYHVEVAFASRRFRLGSQISLASLALAIGLLAWGSGWASRWASRGRLRGRGAAAASADAR